MGSTGEPGNGASQPAERARLVPADERARENRALCSHAHTLMDAGTVLAFRCECKHPLCRDVVVLTLAEYDGATAGVGAVVTLGHATVDGRDVVERTSRFYIVEEARVAV
jgi:hypothetical protein